MTALMAAAVNGRARLVERLLEVGADRGMRSDTAQTALDLARQSGNAETTERIESFKPGWRSWFGSSPP